MKKIIIILAAMAAVLSSCSKNEIESGSTTESKDIVLDISVSNIGADDTKALIKKGWVENDEISIWFDTNTGSTPDLVIKYDGSNWAQTGDANNVPTSGSGYVKAVYKNNVIVASKDNYSVSGNTLSFKIENWVFLTEIQVVVKGLWSENASKYTLSCDEFTPLASTGNGYTVGTDDITVSLGTEGRATNGISNEDGIAFVFATADYSSSPSDKKDFEFTIKETDGIQQTYKPNVAIVAQDGKKSIKALTFASPDYVEIPAMYIGSTTTAIKWRRQNLAITGSGKGDWKPDGSSTVTVTVPGTKENVIIGDYFQWGTHENYVTVNDDDKGLLIYKEFTNVGKTTGNSFEFKSPATNKKYQFATSDVTTTNTVGISPYYDKSATSPTYTKYNSPGGATQLEYSDDAARIILRETWRMPTETEFEKMIAATYWAWDGTDKGYYVYAPTSGDEGGLNGKKSDKSTSISGSYTKADALLFFPAAGIGTSTNYSNVSGAGLYWSSTFDSSNNNNGRDLFLYPSNASMNTQDRSRGLSIRPVSN